jgi:hypothetical protein
MRLWQRGEERMKRMKWYVLALFLLVGVVWSAHAQQVDSKLVGTWVTDDGPCSPCTLTIDANGAVGFTQAGDAVQVVFSQIVPGPGINLTFPIGGKAELSLSKSNMLIGFYQRPQRTEAYAIVAFRKQ